MWSGRSAQEIAAVRLVLMDPAEYLRGQHTMVLTSLSREKQPTRSLCSFDGSRSRSLSTSFERGFIRAAIVSFADLDEFGSVT